MLGWIFLIATVLGNVGLSMSLKQLALRSATTSLVALAGTWTIWVAMACAGLSLGSYAMTLRSLPLSLAYPFSTSATMVSLSVISALVYGEALGPFKAGGIALIIIGTWLLFRST
jgi:multidrug transporter EmrE-like cation transporter